MAQFLTFKNLHSYDPHLNWHHTVTEKTLNKQEDNIHHQTLKQKWYDLLQAKTWQRPQRYRLMMYNKVQIIFFSHFKLWTVKIQHSHSSPDLPEKFRSSWQKCFLSAVVRFTSPANKALVCKYLCWLMKDINGQCREQHHLQQTTHATLLKIPVSTDCSNVFKVIIGKDTHRFCPTVSDTRQPVSWYE